CQSRTEFSKLLLPILKANSRSALNGRNTVDPSWFSAKGMTAEPISLCEPMATKMVRSLSTAGERYSMLRLESDREIAIVAPSDPEIVSLATEVEKGAFAH